MVAGGLSDAELNVQPHFGLPLRYLSTAASSQPTDAEMLPWTESPLVKWTLTDRLTGIPFGPTAEHRGRTCGSGLPSLRVDEQRTASHEWLAEGGARELTLRGIAGGGTAAVATPERGETQKCNEAHEVKTAHLPGSVDDEVTRATSEPPQPRARATRSFQQISQRKDPM
jgi:hypothetical protein